MSRKVGENVPDISITRHKTTHTHTPAQIYCMCPFFFGQVYLNISPPSMSAALPCRLNISVGGRSAIKWSFIVFFISSDCLV